MTKEHGPTRPNAPDPAHRNRLAEMLAQAQALHHQGQWDRAETLCREMLAIAPGQIDALHLLGMMATQQGRYAAAVESLQQAIAIDPGRPALHEHLGLALHRLGHLEAAVASYDRALALQPDAASALAKRGHSLYLLRQLDQALASYDRALTLRPDDAGTLNKRGVALFELKRLDEALASYDRALALRPDSPGFHNNRGIVLYELHRPEEALASYERAIALRPDFVAALNNRAAALLGLKHHAAAAEAFTAVVDIDPDYPYARGYLLIARLQCCDWREYAATAAVVIRDAAAGKRAAHPFSFVAISPSAADQLQCARTYVADACPPVEPPLWTGERYDHPRIRIAYLSADLHDHATAYLMAGLFEDHDRQRFEITAISYGPDTGDTMRARLQQAFDHFIDVRHLGDREVATLMRKAEIDIAVDLKGYTADARPGILAHRPAPVQISYLGYPGTLGAPYIDYVVADPWVIPAADAASYSERPIYLTCYQVNDARRRIAEHTPTRAEAGLPETGLVFCCFNNHYKITPPLFDVWMRLLQQVPDSVLWLFQGNDTAVRNLRLEAGRRGVASERLVFAPSLPLAEHLARHRLADLFLDTSPYNAHTTASDALWAGLPLITCLGTAFAGRVAASLLDAVGLPELVTTTLAEYEALALALAGDPARLSALRDRLAAQARQSPLFDTDHFRRQLESAFLTVWRRAQQGEPPASVSIDDAAPTR